ALLSGLFFSEQTDHSQLFVKTEYLGFYFVQILGYLSLALLMGTVLRKAGMAILGFTVYTLIIEAILRYRFMPDGWGAYLPSQTLSSLLPNPLPGYLGMAPPAPVEAGTIFLSLAYTLGFILLSGWLIAKRDL
ncbi:MAG: hypothetical protein CVV27_11165, partial [Candidatus Melainabacteria bacterium HGW-Melainabacteria-1]